MKPLLFAGLVMICTIVINAEQLPIPYPIPETPVIHSGRYHLLTCGKTCVVLDGAKGLSLYMISYADNPEHLLDTKNAVMTNASMKATVIAGGETFELDQVHDPEARLQIIDQGPGRVAAKVYFKLCTSGGFPHGSGTIDIYLYDGRIHLAQSIYIDYMDQETIITHAGFEDKVHGENTEIIYKGSKIIPTGEKYIFPFGEEKSGFSILVNNPGQTCMKIGWLRNVNPEWFYLREINTNPETDELYEKWPLWITQRGNPITWKRSSNSGLVAHYKNNRLLSLAFRWTNGEGLEVPEGGYTALNGFMAIFLGANSAETQSIWRYHENPKKPEVSSGSFMYYNEIEGVYEVDSDGSNVDVTFPSLNNSYPLPVFLRIWNLKGNGGYNVKVGEKSIPFVLYNDGDRVEDPMVSILKKVTGPARYAGVAFTADIGSISRITMKRRSGLQFTYQMYSKLETWEAWSDACTGSPLFSFHLKESTLYHVSLPGKEDYAFAKLPLFWAKNGLNNNTFMNKNRGFHITSNGPDSLRIIVRNVNLQGTGLSEFTLDIPYERERLILSVNAEFTPLDDGKRWTSLEYCDLYPFDNVFRRTFHYDNIIYLDRDGKFNRVGTGAWSGRFETVYEPERLSYHATATTRSGPGSLVPDSADGTVWILGDNPVRGNILYRRGDWTPSEGAQSVFSLCNAWVDIHNTVMGRRDPSAGESLTYTIEVFGGIVPSLEKLNEMYLKAAGGSVVKQIVGVKYSDDGAIMGFGVE